MNWNHRSELDRRKAGQHEFMRVYLSPTYRLYDLCSTAQRITTRGAFREILKGLPYRKGAGR
jgi:hypothetical protein